MVYKQNGGMVQHGLQTEWWGGSAWSIGRIEGWFTMVHRQNGGIVQHGYRQNGRMVEHGLQAEWWDG